MIPSRFGRKALIVAFLFLVSADTLVHTQPAPPASDPGVPARSAGQPSADPWQFADEGEQEPGWREIVGTQAWDLAGFAALTALALVSFFRKSVRLKTVTLAITVLYLGFAKSQLISIVNVFALLEWNLPIFKYSLAWYLLASFTVLSTVLWGRLYCGRLCAFGAMTQLMDRIVPPKWRRELPPWLEHHAVKVKYVVLGGALLYFILTRDRSIYRYIEPFWMFGFHSSTALWIALGLLLLATVFVRNLYCRYLCPVGAALGVLSNLTVFRIKRWKECNSCKICEKACEWGAIQGPKILVTECVRCDDCERLYMDTRKCPHWIIIKRKGDFAVQR
jgi:NosR/NirI family nitrous oxide reductase transcriptional regulator